MENTFTTRAGNLKGKTALVTGGTTGIGRAAVLMLASMGVKVLFFGRHEDALKDTIDALAKDGHEDQVMGVIADVSNKESIDFVFEQADNFLGRLDILINNASSGVGGIEDGDYGKWQNIINTNVLGYLACCQEAVKRMKDRNGGHIINIGSMSADGRDKGSSIYVATKAGIQGFSEALRKEVNEMGVKVTLIEPGAVMTDMQPASQDEQREKVLKMEMLTSEDIAESILYALIQPKRCDVVEIKIRPHLQLI